MFDVSYAKKKNCYHLESESIGEFYVKVEKCSTYPKSAKRPYKGTVYLIKNNKYIKLRMSDPSSRHLYSVIMDRLNLFIIHKQDYQAFIKEQEEKQYSLLSQNLDDIDY